MNRSIVSMCTLTSVFFASVVGAQNAGTSYNPQISLILDGQYSSYKNTVDSYELPGFTLGGEAGLASEGFAIGHSELSVSANIDDKFYGQMRLAFAEHEDGTETELEEAFFEIVGLGNGFIIRGGRFFPVSVTKTCNTNMHGTLAMRLLSMLGFLEINTWTTASALAGLHRQIFF